MKFYEKKAQQSSNLTEQQLAELMKKHSNVFCQKDELLQKQIVAALERESDASDISITRKLKPQSKIRRLFQFQYTAVALTFVAVISSIIISNNLTSDENDLKNQIVKIKTPFLKVENLDELGRKIENKSIAKMTHESKALKQDLHKLFQSFSLSRSTKAISAKKT